MKKLFKILHFFQYILISHRYDYLLVDTPTHNNIGDSAIVLAEQQLLMELNIKYIEITADDISNMERLYAFFTSCKTIVFVHGGGFLGTLWVDEELRFRRIIKGFNRNKIVVFPQTVTFDLNDSGSEFLEISKNIYGSHKDLTIIVRDDRSKAFMDENMPGVNCMLAPDIVTILKYNKTFYRDGIIECFRGDKEKKISETDINRLRRFIRNRYQNQNILKLDTVLTGQHIEKSDRGKVVYSFLDNFAKSKLVLTDRLHGMVFAAITGTPCIALGNTNGKVKGVYEWVKNNPYVFYANDIEEAEKIVENINIDYIYNYDYNQAVNKSSDMVTLISSLKK